LNPSVPLSNSTLPLYPHFPHSHLLLSTIVTSFRGIVLFGQYPNGEHTCPEFILKLPSWPSPQPRVFEIVSEKFEPTGTPELIQELIQELSKGNLCCFLTGTVHLSTSVFRYAHTRAEKVLRPRPTGSHLTTRVLLIL